MDRTFVVFNQLQKYKFVSSLLIAGSVVSNSQIALADYQPPPQVEICQQEKVKTCKQVKNTMAITSRGGCSANEKTSLTALAPQNHVGITVATRPTWAWFVPDEKPYNLQFQLYRYEADNETSLIWEQNLKSQPGIMTLTLPAEEPELTIGYKYLWKVIIFCDPRHPSGSLVTAANLEVVSFSDSLQTELKSASKPLAIADIYAEQSIWYDALAKAISVTQNNSKSRFELKLLEDLAQIEEAIDLQSTQEVSTRQSYRLRQVIEAELKNSSLSF